MFKLFLKKHVFFSLAVSLTVIYLLLYLLLVFLDTSYGVGNVLGAMVGVFVPFGIWNTLESTQFYLLPLLFFFAELYFVDRWFRAQDFPTSTRIVISFVILLGTTLVVDYLLWGVFPSLASFLGLFNIHIPTLTIGTS
jgi:hypothetical protein